MKQMPHRFRQISGSAVLAFALICSPCAALAAKGQGAEGWLALISGNAASPERIIAVAKERQRLFLFEKHSPLRLVAQYSCTTGKADGDKFVQGDFKTPEGIYFVERRLDSGLNFEKYGKEAYTLNYPNPVDKIRRKTGYGIWIHGRGTPITPKVTEGCVSLNNSDIAVLGKNLTPGTPVALAEDVNFIPNPSAKDRAHIATLTKKTFNWAKAWSGRSRTLFDFYNPEAYSMSQGQSFSSFRTQKERLFKSLPWIDIKLRNVQALQGPGYWVTWFQQDYRAPNLVTKGVRRLYWQKDATGDYRIVGMEWHPQLYGTLTAGLNDAPITTASIAEKQPVQQPAQQAKPVAVVSAKTLSQPLPQTVQPLEPAPKPAPVETPKQVAQPKPVVKTEPAPVKTVAAITPPRKEKEPQKPEVLSTDGVRAFLEVWRTAWERGNLGAYMDCYDAKATQGRHKGASAIRSHKQRIWRNSAPKTVMLTNMSIMTKQNTVIARMNQSYTDSKSFADTGVKTLHLQKKNNTWRIVREDWSAQ